MNFDNAMGAAVLVGLLCVAGYFEIGPGRDDPQRASELRKLDIAATREAELSVFQKECVYREAVDNAAVKKLVSHVKGIEYRTDVAVTVFRYDCSNGVAYWNDAREPGAAFIDDFTAQIATEKQARMVAANAKR